MPANHRLFPKLKILRPLEIDQMATSRALDPYRWECAEISG